MVDIILILSVLIGFILGVLSGLAPGLHVNNFSAIALLVYASLSPPPSSAIPMPGGLCLQPHHLAAMIVAASISQPFLDIVPAIFIGAPDEDTALAVLPGQRMMIDGRGLEAVRLSALGCAGSMLITLALIFPLAQVISGHYDLVQRYVGAFLLVVAVLMIYNEAGPEAEFPLPGERLKYRLIALLVFTTSGALGIFAFKYGDQSIYPSMYEGLISLPPGMDPQVMLPLLSGIFGASSLMLGLYTRNEIPRQMETEIRLPGRALVRSIALGSIGGTIISWIPGLSPSVSATMTRLGLPSTGEEFLVTLSGVNAANALAPLIVIYFLDRPKSGAAAALQEMGVMNHGFLVQITVIAVAAAIAAYIVTITMGLAVARAISRLNYRWLCLIVLAGITAMVIAMTGGFGLFVFAISTMVGLAAPLAGIRRAHAMGVLMLPLIIHYL